MESKTSQSNTVKKELLRNCNLTASNYANLLNKLQKRKIIFQFLLPFYSVIGILNGLLPKFLDFFTITQINLLSFWGVVISITFLVVSMQITLAKYPERIAEATKILNKLKSLKSEIKKTDESNTDKIEELYKQYNDIVHNGEFISRNYFFQTCRDVDKRNGHTKKIKVQKGKKDKGIDSKKESTIVSETSRHFDWLEITYIVFLTILENLLYLLIFILPIIVYTLIFVLVD